MPPKTNDEADDKDQRAARTIPAVYTDSFLVETIKDEGLLRITFGEGTAALRETLRFAAMMPRGDAAELARLIQELIDKTWKVDEEKK